MSFGDDTLAPPDRSEVERDGFRKMAKNMAALIPKGSPGIYFTIIPARADGRVICKGCGLAYCEHPIGMEEHLTLLCDGKQVKL